MVYCLEANNGDVMWENDLVDNYGVDPPDWGFAGSPYVDANLVIYNAGTHGLALNKGDGSLVWETGTDRAGYATPVPFDLDQRRLLILMGRRTFAAVEALTGQVIWEVPWRTRYTENITDPIIDGNNLFVCSNDGVGAALYAMDANDINRVWGHRNMLNRLNSCVLWEGYGMVPIIKMI